MKKKAIIFTLVFIVVILSVVFFRDYGKMRALNYAKFFSETTQRYSSTNKLIITDDVQVDKIIKQTPLNLVFVIKWGDGEKAYVSIKNWATKAHDSITIDTVDRSRWMAIYE